MPGEVHKCHSEIKTEFASNRGLARSPSVISGDQEKVIELKCRTLSARPKDGAAAEAPSPQGEWTVAEPGYGGSETPSSSCRPVDRRIGEIAAATSK